MACLADPGEWLVFVPFAAILAIVVLLQGAIPGKARLDPATGVCERPHFFLPFH
jgi:hypothetical protein